MRKRSSKRTIQPRWLRLGKRIRKLRMRRGWSQSALAERCGIHAHHLGKIERGEANVTIATLLVISSCLKTTISALFRAASYDFGCGPDYLTIKY